MLNEQIQNGLQLVDDQLQEITHSQIELLQDASHHTILAGGKRLRPQIVMLAYLVVGGTDLSQVVPISASIELVHTATLVHDDINDHSMLRRGVASVRGKWGRTFALLAGDFLFAKVYELMAPYGIAYNKIMANACVRLVEGETLQAVAAKSGNLDRETYKQIITLKTASLFEAAAQMGAMQGGGNEETVLALQSFGKYLGLTFQIVDDLLDLVGDATVMGKPVGIDMGQGRGVGMINHQNGGSAVPVAEAVELDLFARLRGSGAVAVATMQAQALAERAKVALEPLPASAPKQALLDLIELVMARTY